MAQCMCDQHQSAKGHVFLEDRVHLVPSNYKGAVSLHILLPCCEKKNCWILQNTAVKCNPPNPHPLTWRWWHLASHSTPLLLRFVSFLFLVYCFASWQSLHVFPWKPFCLLSIFLHYLPFALCFSMYQFFSPFFFYFIFSHPASPFLCISYCIPLPFSLSLFLSLSILAFLRWRTSPLPCSW